MFRLSVGFFLQSRARFFIKEQVSRPSSPGACSAGSGAERNEKAQSAVGLEDF
jgi:hypothetical protein